MPSTQETENRDKSELALACILFLPSPQVVKLSQLCYYFAQKLAEMSPGW